MSEHWANQKELRRLARALRDIRNRAPMTVDEARDVIAAADILEGWDWAEMEDALEAANERGQVLSDGARAADEVIADAETLLGQAAALARDAGDDDLAAEIGFWKERVHP